MSPAGVVSLDVARLAVDVEAVKGAQQLLDATVSQRIDVLTTAVNNVHAQQERASEDRMQQLALLTSLTEKVSAGSGSGTRVHDLELKVSRWIGVVVGFGTAVFMVFALIVYAYQGDKGMIVKTMDTNSAAIRSLQQERRP